jgi:3-methyladenine DNA glycosylase AlkD
MRLLDAGKINNWDLIDTSAPYLGSWWSNKTHALQRLTELAAHEDLWHRRAAVLFTFGLIRDGRFDITLALCEQLLDDKHDLIHKATGWMLREVGNRDIEVLRGFLTQHAATMPRTMLRYAIEKREPSERAIWMRKRSEQAALGA